MEPLDLPDIHHLRAVQGRLELGSHIEANAGLKEKKERNAEAALAKLKRDGSRMPILHLAECHLQGA